MRTRARAVELPGGAKFDGQYRKIQSVMQTHRDVLHFMRK